MTKSELIQKLNPKDVGMHLSSYALAAIWNKIMEHPISVATVSSNRDFAVDAIRAELTHLKKEN